MPASGVGSVNTRFRKSQYPSRLGRALEIFGKDWRHKMGDSHKHLFTIAELSDVQKAVDACPVLPVLSPACPCAWGFPLWSWPGSKGREAGRSIPPARRRPASTATSPQRRLEPRCHAQKPGLRLHVHSSARSHTQAIDAPVLCHVRVPSFVPHVGGLQSK